MLRGCLILGGILLMGGAVVATSYGAPLPMAIWLVIMGLCLTLGVVFERAGDKPPAEKPEPGWIATEERFVDTASGEVVTVFYKPETGERMYVRSAEMK